KEVIPPNVKVMKNNRMDGLNAVFSNTSKRATLVCVSGATVSLYFTREASMKAVSPKNAQIENNNANEILSTIVSHKAGPKANARLPDKPKYPIPSPRLSGGIKSVAIVPAAVVEKPQPIP